MSFSHQVKAELLSQIPSARHCQIAQLTALICTIGQISVDEKRSLHITFHTEQPEMKQHCGQLMKKLFGFSEIQNAKQAYQVLLTVKLLHQAEDKLNKKKKVLDSKELAWDGLILQRSCCKRAFLRGLFLACGSVNNPEKAYHLEMVFASAEMAGQVLDILRDLQVEGKCIQRKNHYVVYLKDGSMIVDFLNNIGAPLSLMQMENIRIFKDVRNGVNRRVNCEAANINKTVSASKKQIENILLIEEKMGFQKLPRNLRQIAELRLREPEASLKELGEMVNPPVTKSGVNHRLRKISQIADDLRERQY